MFKRSVLENGLRIITAPMKGTNTVTILVLCGTGSDYESREINGISHFLEHMFFKGTQKRPEASILSNELDSMGSVYNAFTSHEVTGYFIKAAREHFEKSLEILADIYRNSLIKEEEVEHERQVIIEEMHRDRDIPTLYIWWLWENLLYGDQPAGWDVIGTEEVIRRLKRQDFVDYFYHQYVASNTAIVVAGSIDEETIVEKVIKFFGDVRQTPPIRNKPMVKEVQSSPNLYLQYKETDQTHLTLGFRGYPADHPKRYVAEVLAALLGSGFSSRMFSQIRERMGLAYTVFTVHEEYSNRGFLVTYVGVDHRNVEKTIHAVLREYQKVYQELVSPQELRKVKDYLRGTTAISLEASDAVANFIGNEEMTTGRPMTVDEVFARIEAVTPEDISSVAKDIIKPEGLNLAMIGPFKDDAAFRKIINKF